MLKIEGVALKEGEVGVDKIYPLGFLEHKCPETIDIFSDNSRKLSNLIGVASLKYDDGEIHVSDMIFNSHKDNDDMVDFIKSGKAYATPFGTGKVDDYRNVIEYNMDGMSINDSHSMKSIKPLRVIK